MGEPKDYILCTILVNLYRGFDTHLDITSHTSYSSFHSINNYRTERLPKSLLLSLMPRPWTMLLLRMKRKMMRPSWRRRPMKQLRRRPTSQQPRKLIVLPLRVLLPHLLLSRLCFGSYHSVIYSRYLFHKDSGIRWHDSHKGYKGIELLLCYCLSQIGVSWRCLLITYHINISYTLERGYVFGLVLSLLYIHERIGDG